MRSNQKTILIIFTIALLGLVFWFVSSNIQSDRQSEAPQSDQSDQSEHSEQSSLSADDDQQRSTASDENKEPPQKDNKEPQSKPTSTLKSAAKKTVNTQPTEKSILDFFSLKASGNWKVRFNSKGEPFRVLGGEIPGVTRDMASVQDFVAEAAPEFGIPAEQLAGPPEVTRTKNNDIYDSVQHFRGIEVYGAYFRVIGNSRTGAAYIVNPNTKPVNENEVVVPVRMTASEAEGILRDYHGDKLKTIKSVKGPLVWANESPHQLVYQFRVKLKDDDHRTLVGAQTRDVVLSQSERMHTSKSRH